MAVCESSEFFSFIAAAGIATSAQTGVKLVSIKSLNVHTRQFSFKGICRPMCKPEDLEVVAWAGTGDAIFYFQGTQIFTTVKGK